MFVAVESQGDLLAAKKKEKHVEPKVRDCPFVLGSIKFHFSSWKKQTSGGGAGGGALGELGKNSKVVEKTLVDFSLFRVY